MDSLLHCSLFKRILTIEGTSQTKVYCILLSLYKHTTSENSHIIIVTYLCYKEYRFFAIEPDLVMVSECACNQDITNIKLSHRNT